MYKYGHHQIKIFREGDIITIKIPKVDIVAKTDRQNIICKVHKVLSNGHYQLQSRFGIIKVNYSSNEMESTSSTDFSELDELENALTTYVSVREISQLQSQHNNILNIVKCKCPKTDCQNMRCPCKKENKKCNNQCHPDRDRCSNMD
jgi:hypothetical protein